MVCLNCGNTYKGNYCSECGQQATVERFNWQYLWKTIQTSFDIDKGFFHTILVLLYKPGLVIREYVEGKRIGLSNPVKVFILTGAVATYFTFNFLKFGETAGPLQVLNLPDQLGFGYYSGKYFSFFTLTALPCFAWFSWIIFRPAFNFTENLIMNVYVAAGQFLIILLFIPLLNYSPTDPIIIVSGLVNFSYNVWVLSVFFKVRGLTGFVKAIIAVALPQIAMMFINYFLYRLAPKRFWEFLDVVFG